MKSYEFVLRRLATILSVAIISLSVMAAVTGILLSFYYEPVAGRAYQSLNWIDTEIPNGLLIHSIHDIAGNALIVTALIQIVVMFLGRQFRSSWLTAWISGILLTLTGIGLSWTAIILDWSQVGYWRFRIELSTIEAIPFIGGTLRNILTGGGAVNTTTVAHLYTIHSYLLSVGAIALAIVHLWSLLQQEKEMKGAVAETSLMTSEVKTEETTFSQI
ncbi:cytochrome b N-terminal domain-containing protein [Chroogloeocystis siderophila]|jgi:cytochrome b6|uniref:Cytochrome B6 n=1 Tax=Chroogloeocystis siderophila 5.2 s.c.1 TaxID=247279 RepID=A0A1U7HHS9_9CHRO|nr:cytochrome b N-terminal domain-containing protein [Chroogloeocystis siderophila]OKH23127.1 cytochrome B6 [Chroogloeocystis siderophila 5.2 s.c.1]